VWTNVKLGSKISVMTQVKIISFIALMLTFGLLTSAQAIYGGVSALDSKLVLTIASSKTARSPFCSAAMLTERIVVTAAHCIVKDQGSYPDLRFKLGDVYVTQPGVNIGQDDFEARVKIVKVVVKPGYTNIWKPESGDESTQRDDIAFLFLEKSLIENYTINVASKEEVATFVSGEKMVEHYGYGMQKQNFTDGIPYTLSLKSIKGHPTLIDSHPRLKFDTTTTMFTKEDGRALCPGDSGSPWYGDFNGERKIIAVTVGASGCRSEPPYNGSTLGTLIYPYLELMGQEWEKFLKEELLRAEEAKARVELEAKAKVEALEKAKPKLKSNKTSITCVKGKQTKKITAVKPKCPRGYKKK